MRASLAALLASFSLTSAACVSQPAPDARTPISEMKTFTQFSTSGTAQLPERWWQALPDPALHALIEDALRDGFDIKIAWTRLRQAEAAARAAGATRYPTLDGSAGAGTSAAGTFRSSSVSTDTSVSYGLAASYEIDLWGGIGAQRDAAVASAKASAFDLQSAAITVSADLAVTWYQLAQAEAQLALLEKQLATSVETLDLVGKRAGAGLVPEADRVSQEQSVESLRGQIASQQPLLAVYRHQINLLRGRAPDAALPVATLVDVPAAPALGVPAEVLQRRPDIQAAWSRVAVSNYQLAVAISEKYPRLSLSARLGSGASLSSWATSLAASLAAPLFDGGRRSAEVDRARASETESVLSYQRAVVAAAVDVEDALAREAGQTALLASLDKQQVLADSTLESARTLYKAGLTDHLRVLDAERSQQSVERERLSARQELLELRIALYRALAGGFTLTAPAKLA